jgi:hypothetical protein
MKCPVDWVMTHKGPGHAAHMSGDLLKAVEPLSIAH